MSTKNNSIGGIVKDLPRTGLGDKLDHVIAGSVIAVMGYYLGVKTGFSLVVSALGGLAGTAAIALFFEIAQRLTKSGIFDWWDFVATIAPAVVFAGLIYWLR